MAAALRSPADGADMERHARAGQVEVRLRASFKLDIVLRHLEAGRQHGRVRVLQGCPLPSGATPVELWYACLDSQGRDCRTQLLDLAVLPWPLRDAMGQDLVPTSDVPLLQGKRQRVVINRQTALDAERWWPAL
ncbi:unnamed protein product [Symbiodinium necroappetens]|uniref:Uncharacterized protein n=1 Tax=Symbiodinium necroappetens TaxID=1628268 RepID=A0A812N7G4_9DINO|nr:unnamed protein product [Symbiodinium necroappetens]